MLLQGVGFRLAWSVRFLSYYTRVPLASAIEKRLEANTRNTHEQSVSG